MYRCCNTRSGLDVIHTKADAICHICTILFLHNVGRIGLENMTYNEIVMQRCDVIRLCDN